MTTRLNLWRAKVKALKHEEHQWAKVYNQAERAMTRIGKRIDELERKIDYKLAKAK